jgi:methyl-accepting chemotaxis protein
VRKVENGSELVNRSGQTLEEIVQSVKRVTDIVAEIAAASQEQASGIEQVNKATLQMDQVTQANSSQTEEMSGTAQALSSSAEQLQAMVKRFRLGDESRPAAAHAKAAVKRPTKKPAGLHAPAKEPALAALAKHTGTSDEEHFEEF